MRLARWLLAALAAHATLGGCSAPPAPPARTADWVAARCALAEAARCGDRDEEALAGFRAVLAAAPACAAAHRSYQDLLLAQGKGDALRAEYAELAERLGEPWCLELYGRVLFDPLREEELYRRALEQEPESLALNKALSSALHRQMRFEEAAEVNARCIELAPEDLDAHLGFVEQSHRSGRGEGVLGRYEQLLLQDPGSVIAHLALFCGLLLRSDLEGAAAHLACAEELAPELPSVRRARLALAVKRDDRAELDAALRACLDADPADAGALALAGGYLVRKEADEEEGERMLREAHRLAPTRSDALAALGGRLLRDMQILEAEPMLDEALRRNPADSSALRAKAHLASLRKKHEQARELCEQARRIDDTGPARRQLLGAYCRLQLFDKAGALMDSTSGFDGFASQDPQQRADDRLSATRVYLLLGRAEDAWTLASAEVDAETCHPTVLGAAAEVLERTGDAVGARVLVERALARSCAELDPKDGARLHAQLARLLLKENRREEAYAEYRHLWWEHSKSIPAKLPLQELIETLGATSDDAERGLLPEVFTVRVHGKNSCLSDATVAVIEHNGGRADPEDLEVLLEDKQLWKAACMLDEAEGLDAVLFMVDQDSVKRLIQMGHPVLVTLPNLYEDGEFGGHAALALGYDDRLGAVHVVDNGYLMESGLVAYSAIEGCPGLAIIPQGSGEEARAWLPGVEYCQLLEQAEMHIEQSEWDAARELLELAVAENPNSPFAYWGLLGVRGEQGTLDDPSSLLERICGLPGAGAAHLDQLGHFRMYEDDLAGAKAAFSKALECMPNCLHVMADLIEIAMTEEESPDSILTRANRVLELDPYHAEALGYRGYARLWAGNTYVAVEDFELSLGLEESSLVWWHLATAREWLDDLPGALAALERCESLDIALGAEEEELTGTRERIEDIRARLAATSPAQVAVPR
jgi:tetratricopeptide (TPR) repeat protein